MEWKEVNQENYDEIIEMRKQRHHIVFATNRNSHKIIVYGTMYELGISVELMVAHGGYYYIVLPKCE